MHVGLDLGAPAAGPHWSPPAAVHAYPSSAIVPQAVRIVIPAVTNDFIALFKDTSVCSVISVVELTKQYNISRNSGGTYELAIVTALLYLLMSIPLARLAQYLENRMGRGGY